MTTESSATGAAPDARARILAAARDAFAQHGFDGASIRDITAAAGANLGAITYHFGSKDALYNQVLMALVGPLGARLRWALQPGLSALDRVERVVRAFFDHIHLHPQMPGIMVRELASGRTIAQPIVTMLRTAIPMVAAVIAEGQQDGSIRAGDPLLLTLSTFAQPVYLNLARPVLATVTTLDFADPAAYARVVDHAALVVRRALEAR